jgi:hypothetical protein
MGQGRQRPSDARSDVRWLGSPGNGSPRLPGAFSIRGSLDSQGRSRAGLPGLRPRRSAVLRTRRIVNSDLIQVVAGEDDDRILVNSLYAALSMPHSTCAGCPAWGSPVGRIIWLRMPQCNAEIGFGKAIRALSSAGHYLHPQCTGRALHRLLSASRQDAWPRFLRAPERLSRWKAPARYPPSPDVVAAGGDPDEDQIEQTKGYGRPSWPTADPGTSLQLTGQADFWHPTGMPSGR